MSNSLKALCAFALLAVVAACGNRNASNEEFVVVDPAPAIDPVSTEPVFTGKYGN